MEARVRKYFKRLIIGNREFISTEILAVKGLMELLMKPRNTGDKWTVDQMMEIKSRLRIVSKVIPAMAVFMLPGGSLLLPLLVEILDRRKKNAMKTEEQRRFALETGTKG